MCLLSARETLKYFYSVLVQSSSELMQYRIGFYDSSLLTTKQRESMPMSNPDVTGKCFVCLTQIYNQWSLPSIEEPKQGTNLWEKNLLKYKM